MENTKIEELCRNEEFKAAALKVETVEEAVELCGEYGIEVTGEELVEAIRASQSDELQEDALAEVSGGGIVAGVYALGFIFGMSPLGALLLCGGAIVAGVAIARHCR